jgi:hypothetical protein
VEITETNQAVTSPSHSFMAQRGEFYMFSMFGIIICHKVAKKDSCLTIILPKVMKSGWNKPDDYLLSWTRSQDAWGQIWLWSKLLCTQRLAACLCYSVRNDIILGLMHPLTHLFNTYLVGTYSISDTMLGTRDTKKNKTKSLTLRLQSTVSICWRLPGGKTVEACMDDVGDRVRVTKTQLGENRWSF